MGPGEHEEKREGQEEMWKLERLKQRRGKRKMHVGEPGEGGVEEDTRRRVIEL